MIPFAHPVPPRLSDAADDLRAIEDSAQFSNFGPVNTRFEQALCRAQFGGLGACLTVCNATLGLMIAIREATLGQRSGKRVFALMPSFTFAAAAQAALWCGLTPLFCDIDPETWAADPDAEARLIARYRGRIAVVVPYATFGYDIDLAHYEHLTREHGIPVVVDAAASLGTRDATGRGFGTGFTGAVVFSMHATKTFATGEGGVIYSADPTRIATLRAMSNFGFGAPQAVSPPAPRAATSPAPRAATSPAPRAATSPAPRAATIPGLNAKLSEVAALVAERRLAGFGAIVRHRASLAARYRSLLPSLAFQPAPAGEQAQQFVPALLPRNAASLRSALVTRMQSRGVHIAHYFSPHVAEHPLFRSSRSGSLRVTEDVAARIISLPVHDGMTVDQVAEVADCLAVELRALRHEQVADHVERWPSVPSAHDVPASRAGILSATASLHR